MRNAPHMPRMAPASPRTEGSESTTAAACWSCAFLAARFRTYFIRLAREAGVTPSRRFACPCVRAEVSGREEWHDEEKERAYECCWTRHLQSIPYLAAHPRHRVVVDALVDSEVLVAEEERNLVHLADDVLLVSAYKEASEV